MYSYERHWFRFSHCRHGQLSHGQNSILAMLFTNTATRVHQLDQFDHREESETDPQIQNASIASDYSLVGHGRLCLLQCDFLGLNKNMY